MGKCRSKESCISVNESQPRSRKRSKKRDSSEKTTTSAAVQKKYAWILQNESIVLCEKLPLYEVPKASKTSNSHAPSVKLDIVSPDILNSSQKRLKLAKESVLSSTREPFCKTEDKLQKSKKGLTLKTHFKDSSSHSSCKKSKINNATVYIAASTSKCKVYLTKMPERISGKASMSCNIPSIKRDSSDEEFIEISNNVEKVGVQSKVKVKRCTACDEEGCCWNLLKEDKSKKKKSKKMENNSSSSKRKLCFQASETNSSQCVLPAKLKEPLFQRAIVPSPSRKRTKDLKSKRKRKETSHKQVSTKEERREVLKKPKKLIAVFTPKRESEEEGSSSSSVYIDQKSPTISRINKKGSDSDSSVLVRYLSEKQMQVNRLKNLSKFSIPFEPNNSKSLSSQGSSRSRSKTLQEKTNLVPAKPNSKINFIANSFSTKQKLKSKFNINPVLKKRMKPTEYFPDLNFESIFKSETKTSHPKASANGRNNQNQMLEAAIFPKMNQESGSSNQESFNKFKRLYNADDLSYISPLSYQENEMKYFQSTNNSEQQNVQKCTQDDVFPQINTKIKMNGLNFSNLSNEIGIQSIDNQENGNFVLKNSIDSKFSSSREITNGMQYYEKDRFRHSPIERIRGNSDDLAKINQDEAVSEFEAGHVASTTDNDFLFDEKVPLVGSQLSYPDYLQKEPLEAPLGNPAEESDTAFQNEFSYDTHPMSVISDQVMELLKSPSHLWDIPDSENNQLLPSISKSKKHIKIMKSETIPSTCIKILPRPKTLDKNGKLSQEASEMNGQKFGTENSQEKVAVIKLQNLEQLRKDESLLSQKSALYDYDINGEELIHNLSLITTQEENSLFNSSILDPNFVLENLSCDGFLEDDLVNNNEKMVSQSNGHIDACNPDEVKESKLSLNIENGFGTIENNAEAPDLSEMVKLFDQKGNFCVTAVNLGNHIPKFDEITKVNNCMSDDEETTTCTASNIEEFNSVTEGSELNECFSSFKEPDWNSVHAANEGINKPSTHVSNQRKRRWFDEKQKSASQQSDKKVKLKRRTWSQNTNEAKYYTDTSSEVSGSCRSSLYDVDHNMVQINTEAYNVNDSLVKNTVDTKTSRSLTFTNLKVMAEESLVKINEPKKESNSEIETNQVNSEITLIKESQVDPEPEPERGDSDNQPPRKEQKAKYSSVRRKKRKNGHRSKFLPSCYSDSTSSTSDDELTKNKGPSTDDELEIEGKNNLLKLRLQRELTDLPDKINSNFSEQMVTTMDDISLQEEQEDDILSVIASPSLMDLTVSSRCETPLQPSEAVQSEYSDTGEFCWETFKRKNVAELACDLRSFVEKKHAERIQSEKKHVKMEVKIQAESSTQPDKSDDLFAKPFAPLSNVKTQIEPLLTSNENTATLDQRPSRVAVSRIFIGICHRFLSCGRCMKNMCSYDHKIPIWLQVFQNQTEQQVFNTVRDGINTRFTYYVKTVYKTALKRLNYNLGLQLYSEIYNSNLLNEVLLSDTLEVLWQKEGPFSKVIKDMAEYLQPQSIMVAKLLILADSWAPRNEYWETLRSLIWKSEIYPHIVEKILFQCISDKGNKARIKQVAEFVLATNSFQTINEEMWIAFYNLLTEPVDRREEQVENLDVRIDNRHNIATQGIASLDGISHSPDQLVYQGYDNPQEPIDMEICNSPDSDTNYRLMPIDDLSSPKSCNRDQDNTGEFFTCLTSLQDGLKHGDYQFVVSILKLYVNTDRTLFTRHCHKVLVSKIKESQVHVDNIIKIAVRTGELREILYSLGTYVLISLADQGLWVHAYELLKTLQTYELHNKNAGFILLAAEICLANHRFEKALTLLKQSDIIFTNCKKWKVASNREDVHLRTSIVTLLLESLCQESAERAFFVFDLILGEQPSNSYPVDLTRIVDKLMLSLLSQNHIDLVMSLCKKAMRYDLHFHETTFRAVITALVPNDLILARQFYQYATYLGVYRAVEVYPITHVIINVDWSEEEMYIVVLEFLRKLFLNIGFTVSHLRPNQLTVFFVFEVVPMRKQLYHEHSDSSGDRQKINKSKTMIKNILQTRFDPPISLVKKEQSRICKIKSRSLVNYLKAGHFTAYV